MHTATKACFFILAAAVTSMLSGVVALPSSELDSVPKTKEHAGVGVNLPKQRADPADVEWMKRDGEEIPSPTGQLVTKDTHVDTEIISPFGGTKI